MEESSLRLGFEGSHCDELFCVVANELPSFLLYMRAINHQINQKWIKFANGFQWNNCEQQIHLL